MNQRSRFVSLKVVLLALVLATGVLVFSSDSYVHAQESQAIRVVSSGAESNFPDSVRFFAQVQSQNELQDVRVNFRAGARGALQYNYLDIPRNASGEVSGTYEQRLNTPDRYMPPGSRMRYNFEITDKAGNVHATEDQELVIVDARPKFQWQTVTVGAITVYYSGPIETRARRMAEVAQQTLENMKGVTGSEIETPVTVTLYANNADMIGAVQARSATISRELITEGQAFAAENVVLVLAGNRDVGTVSHELVHILVGRAAGLGTPVPTWLNEGLAEYGNLDPTVSYDRFLEWGVDTNRILPLWRLANFPADPNLTIVSYGQARSAVNYMISKYGTDKMAALLAALGRGRPVEAAIQEIYGFGLRQLDAEWREFVGAEPYSEPTPPPTSTPGAATPTSTPGLLPYSITALAGQGSRSPTPAPTATAEPTAAPTALPAQDPTPLPAETTGGGCGRSRAGAVEASSLLGLIALGGLAGSRLARRWGRR